MMSSVREVMTLARPSDDAHHILSEFHHWAALAGAAGRKVADADSCASAEVHAARLAAALGDVLAELAECRHLAAVESGPPPGAGASAAGRPALEVAR